MENLIVVYSVLIERHDDLAEKRIKSSCGIIILQRNCVYIHPIHYIFLSFFLLNRHAVLYLSRRQLKPFGIKSIIKLNLSNLFSQSTNLEKLNFEPFQTPSMSPKS